MENYMNNNENNRGLSQDSLINLFLHTATKEDLTSHKSEVDRRFNEVDKTISEFKSDVNRRFDQVDRQFDQVDRQFDQVNGRIDKIQTFLYWIGGLVVASIVIPIALPSIKAMF